MKLWRQEDTTVKRENWRSIVRERIGMARGGDRESALWLMREYCRAIEQGAFPLREIGEYFGSVFGDILEMEADREISSKAVYETLGLAKGGHRQMEKFDRNKRNRGLVLALAVRDCKGPFISDKEAIDSAITEVATWDCPWLWRWSQARKRDEEDHDSEIKTAWKEYRDVINDMPEEWLVDIRTWHSLPEPPQREYFLTPTFDSDWELIMTEGWEAFTLDSTSPQENRK